MSRLDNINDIVNQVAIEVGLRKVDDVFASTDDAFVQLRGLANSVGYELAQMREWQGLKRKFSFTTVQDQGSYALPVDFAGMINQTGWNETTQFPLQGPISDQWWAMSEAVDVAHTIYLGFRFDSNAFEIWPQPTPGGMDVSFYYQSRNWVNDSAGGERDNVTQKAHIPRFEPYLFQRALKVRFLQARGFDTTAAVDEYRRAVDAWGSKDKGAPILNAGWGRRWARFLDRCNMPETYYGR